MKVVANVPTVALFQILSDFLPRTQVLLTFQWVVLHFVMLFLCMDFEQTCHTVSAILYTLNNHYNEIGI